MNRNVNREKLRRMTGMAILAAVIVVVQVICTFVKFGPFSITLALAPIIVGCALYGAGAGAFLGGVFGLVVLVTGLFGWDGGTVLYLFGQNAIATILICIVKGAAAGYVSGLAYKLIEAKSKLGAVVVSGIACPIVNTGLFVLGMMAFFMSDLSSWGAAWASENAPDTGLVYYIIFGLAGINFVVELVVNLALSSGIKRIIDAVDRT